MPAAKEKKKMNSRKLKIPSHKKKVRISSRKIISKPNVSVNKLSLEERKNKFKAMLEKDGLVDDFKPLRRRPRRYDPHLEDLPIWKNWRSENPNSDPAKAPYEVKKAREKIMRWYNRPSGVDSEKK